MPSVTIDTHSISEEVFLADGGVYDNLGLEAAFKLYRTILVSDAGAHISDVPRAARTWGMAMLRVTHVIGGARRRLLGHPQ